MSFLILRALLSAIRISDMHVVFILLLIIVISFVVFAWRFGGRNRFFVTFFIVFLSVSLSFFSVFSVFAQNSPNGHKLQTVAGVFIQRPGGSANPVSTEYFTMMFGDKKKWLAPTLYDQTKASVLKALDQGVWGVYQVEGTDSKGRSYKYVKMFWMDDSREPTTISAQNFPSYTVFTFMPPVGHCFKEVSLNLDGQVVSFTESGSDKLSCGLHMLDTRSHKLFLFSGDYVLHSSAEGLVDSLPKGVDDIPFIPLFWYKVEKLNFWGVYNGLGQVQGGAGDIEKPKLDFNNWLWKVYNADDNFNIRGDPLFSYKTAGFNYDFTTYGNYIVTVEYDIHPPRVPPANVKPLKFTFKLKIDGSSYSSTSYDTCDSDGNCKVPEESCEFYSDAAARIQCRMRKAFNFGVFGPSLTAVNQMFSSFIVKQPKCLIPLSDTAVLGRTVSFSSFQSGVCARSDQLRQSFSVVPVLLNFFLAILLLAMIVGVVNRVTNPHDNKIVEAP